MSEKADIVARTIRDVAELPDRTSPDDWPEAMIVTSDELSAIVSTHLASAEAAALERAAQDNERLAKHYRRAAALERIVGEETRAVEKDEAARALDLAASRVRALIPAGHSPALVGEAEVERLRAALDRSVRLQSHYAELLNTYDGGQRMQFASAEEWMKRLEEIGHGRD